MKQANYWMGILLLVLAGFAEAAVCTSLSAGRWDQAARWSCGRIPLATDTVVIAHNNVQMRGNYTVAGLTVNAGAVLDGNNRNLTVNGAVAINGTYNTNGGNLTTTGGGALAVNTGGVFDFNGGAAVINGNVVINGTLSSGGDAIRLTGASTTLSGTGNVVNTTIEVDAAGVSIPIGANLKFDANSAIDVADNVSTASLTVNGTIDGTAQAAGDRIIRVSTGGSLTVGSTGVINAPNSQLNVRTGASATNNGTITIGELIGRTGAPAPVFTQGVNSTLNISIAVCSTANPCTFNASAAGNTVNYNGAAQTVKLPSGAPATYYNLTLSGSGAKTLPSGITVAGDFTMSGSATVAAPAALTVGGDFIVGAGNTFTSGAGTVTLNGASAQIIGGGATDLSLFNLTVNNPAGLTLARNVIVTGTLTGTVTLTSTCPTDYTLNSNGGATVQHSCPVPVGPHHLRVQHDGNGLTCTPEILTVIACANAACTAPHYTANAVGGNVTWAGAPGGSVPFNITTGGTTTVNFPVTTVQTVTLGTSAVSPVPLNGSDCVNTAGGAACSLPFADSGLLINAPNHAAETVQNMTISAVRKANNALNCIPAFNSVSRAINLKCVYANPSTGTLPVRVAGVALNSGSNAAAACDAAGQSPTLSFDANGTATTTLQYADVGQMTLDATYVGSAGTGDAGLNMVGSGNFIAAPTSFGFSAVSAGPIKSGNAFSATITALNAAGNATPNFGKETAPEGVTLTSTLITPNPVTYPAAGNPTPGNNLIAGAEFGAGGMVNDANGLATVNNLSWAEVGSITLGATLTSASYLASGLNAIGSSATIGAFIPDHFDTAVVATATTPMPCPTGLTCPTSYNGFVYSGQTFSAQVTARNLAGGTTANYHSAYGLSNNVTLTAWDALGSVVAQNPGPGVLANMTLAATAFSSGIGLMNTQAYTFATSATTPADVFLRAADTVNATVTSRRATPATSVEGGVKVVSGRAKIGNAHGSELLDLPMTATVQYYNGTSWLTSVTDSVTSLTLGLSNYQSKSGGGWTTTASPASGQGIAGVLSFKLTKPTGGGTGSVDVSIGAPDYLLASGNGAGTNPSNTGRATFGVYKGNNEFIYLRESY